MLSWDSQLNVLVAAQRAHAQCSGSVERDQTPPGCFFFFKASSRTVFRKAKLSFDSLQRWKYKKQDHIANSGKAQEVEEKAACY